MSAMPERAEASRFQSTPVIITTTFREHGIAGVHTHFQTLRPYLLRNDVSEALVIPFYWGRVVAGPVFGMRYMSERWNGSAIGGEGHGRG
jgi:hypothetical protein